MASVIMERTAVALKEWAVAVEALLEGVQIVLLRKGGIREEAREFRLEDDGFLLYPTYQHQRADLLKEEHRRRLAGLLHPGGEPQEVEIRAYGRVQQVVQTLDPAGLEALAPHYIYTQDYAEQRLRWKPRKPLYIVLLRVFRLARPVPVRVLPEYGGCKSWLTLAGEVSLEGMEPVLSDEAYRARARAVREALKLQED